MDITKFCATIDPRSYMHKPMRHDGYLYATTGHIAVRIADDPAIEAGPMPQNLQNGILQKMADYTEDRTWQPVQMGRAAINQDSKLMLALMKEIAVEYGSRARAAIAKATGESE